MKTALLLLNFGGPQNAGEVEPFLYELFRDVIDIPGPRSLRDRLASGIARKRAPHTIAQYEQIGGGSPLVPMTFKQAEALQALLGPEVTVHVGMRYTAPGIDQAIAGIQATGAERLVVLALFPHFSLATTGSCFDAVAQALAARGMNTLPLHFIPAWHDDPDYLLAMKDLIQQAIARVPASQSPHLLFSAHGLPVSFVRNKKDPYQTQVQQTVRDLLKGLDWQGSHSLAYQSRVGRARWLGPSMDQEIKRLAASGTRALVVVPVSFVGDHIETLFELDIEYKNLAHAAGIPHIERADALDAHPRFIRCLANQVTRALLRDRQRDCVRCLLPKDASHPTFGRCPDCHFKQPAFVAFQAACPDAQATLAAPSEG